MENIRTSSRLSRDSFDSDDSNSDDDDDYANESTRAPENNPVWDSEDKRWRSYTHNKFVYFRWSTAHNSKNRFKGIVLEHRSRVPRPGYTITSTLSDGSRRVDYLDIKTYGISEDTYVMGKDIREMYILPSKSVLMGITSDEEARKLAVRKWTSKFGWNVEESSTTSTAASTPKLTASIPPVVKKKHILGSCGHKISSKKRNSYGEQIQPQIAPLATADLYIPNFDEPGIHGISRHFGRCFARKINFSFSHNIY